MVRQGDLGLLFGVHHERWAVWQRAGMAPRGTSGPIASGLGARCWHPAMNGPAAPDASSLVWTRAKRPDLIRTQDAGRQHYYEVPLLMRVRMAMRRLEAPYADPQRTGVWRVPIASRKGRYEALIDEGDLPVVQGRWWNLLSTSDDDDTRVVVLALTRGVPPMLRRILMGVLDEPELNVSHMNGDPLDCRRANLCVRSNVERNRAMRKQGTHSGRVCSSRYKGVCWSERKQRWRAYIRFENKQQYLGKFELEDDAALAYDEAARELFGVHARLNLPGRGEPINPPGARLAA